MLHTIVPNMQEASFLQLQTFGMSWKFEHQRLLAHGMMVWDLQKIADLLRQRR